MDYCLKATWTYTAIVEADSASQAVQLMLNAGIHPAFTSELVLEMVEILEERP